MSDNNTVEGEIIEHEEAEELSYAERRKAEAKIEGRHKKEEAKIKRKEYKKAERKRNKDAGRRKGKINVTKTCEKMGFNPFETLIHIAMGNNEALGTDEEIRVFERRAAAQTVAPYVSAPYKSREYVEDVEELQEIPIYLGPREVPKGVSPDDNKALEHREEDEGN